MEEKRVALRRALKREYMKQGYDPAGSNATGGKRVFDAAFYRWSAIHNSQEILVRSSVRNFGIYFATFIIPVIIGTKIINSDMVSVQKLLFAQFLSLNLNIFVKNLHFWCTKLQFWSNISKYRLKNSKCGRVQPRSDIP